MTVKFTSRKEMKLFANLTGLIIYRLKDKIAVSNLNLAPMRKKILNIDCTEAKILFTIIKYSLKELDFYRSVCMSATYMVNSNLNNFFRDYTTMPWEIIREKHLVDIP